MTKARRETRCQFTVVLLQPNRTTTILVSPNPSVPHLKANKGDLHREDRSQAVDSAVGYVYPVGEASGQHQHKNVQGDQVNQKDVATPWGDLARETKKKQVPGLNTLHGRAQTEHVWFSWGHTQDFHSAVTLRSTLPKEDTANSHGCQKPRFFNAINKTLHKKCCGIQFWWVKLTKTAFVSFSH